MHDMFYALNDLTIEVEITDIDPGTGLEIPIASVDAFLATTPDATVPDDPSLVTTGTNTSGNLWLVQFDRSIMLPAVLNPLFTGVPAYAIIEGGDARVVLELQYQENRPAVTRFDLGELKRMLSIDDADTTQDEALHRLLHAALLSLEGALNRRFGEVDSYTEYIDGSDRGRNLWLAEEPDTGTLVLEEWDGSAWVTVAAGDFDIRSNGLRRIDSDYWESKEYRATYTKGYDTLPADVHQAVLAVAVAMYRATGNAGLRSETIGRYSYTMGSEQVSAAVGADFVAHWKRWTFA
jgi:hypothetical protein